MNSIIKYKRKESKEQVQVLCLCMLVLLLSLQTKLAEYTYLYKNIENTSLEMSEALCEQDNDSHLLSINSHEEQQLVHSFYNEMMDSYHYDTFYIFISLKKQVLLV